MPRGFLGDHLMRVGFAAVLFVALVSSAAAAAELHVPGAFATVSAALDAAAPGDEIVLAAGVFPLATTRDGIDVTIRGAGRDVSFLDGGGANVLLLTNSTLVLRALTVRNGSDGVNVSDGSALLEAVRFETCTRDGFELGRGSAGVATDVEFVHQGDDGIDLGRDASLLCTGCLIADNGDDGIEIRLQDFTGPAVTVEVAHSRIERNGGVGIQLIDDQDATARSFHFHDVLIASNVDGGVTWQCCSDSGEDLEGWPGDEPVLIERATIVGNGGPGVEGGAAGLMEVRDSIVFGNAFELYQVGGPLGTNLVGVDPLFTTDHRLSLASPAVGAAPGGGDLGAFPLRACSDGADNDGDGLVDLADAGCASLDDANEFQPSGFGFGCGIGPELALAFGALALYCNRSRSVRGPSAQNTGFGSQV